MASGGRVRAAGTHASPPRGESRSLAASGPTAAPRRTFTCSTLGRRCLTGELFPAVAALMRPAWETPQNCSNSTVDRRRYPPYPPRQPPPWEWRQLPAHFTWEMNSDEERALPRALHSTAYYPGHGKSRSGSALVIFGGLGQMGMPQRGDIIMETLGVYDG